MNSPTALFLLCLLASFLLGSLPFGLWIARFRGIDLKKVGSGNIGFTNVWRSVGRTEGIVCLIADVAKGAIPAAFAPGFLPAGETEIPRATVAALCGLAAILGHCFTPFARFRGGKGVATSFGVFLALDAFAVGICAVVFVALVAATRYISLGSLASAILLPILIVLRHGLTPLFYMAAAVGLLVVFLHRGNIRRLIDGTERRFTFSKPPPSRP